MNRKILSILFIFILAVSAVGCTEEVSAKEKLQAASMNGLEMESAEQDMNMHLSVDVGETSDPMMDMVASMLKDVNLNMHSKSILKERPTMEMTGSAELSGMTYNVELYMNETQMAIKIPMIEQYIVQSLENEDGEYMTISKEEALDLSRSMYDSMFEKITEEDMTMVEETITVNGEDVNVHTITVTFDDESAKAFIKDMVQTVLSDESLIDTMAASQQAQYESMGMEMTEEEIKAELESALQEFESGWEEAVQYFTVNTLRIDSSVDQNDQIVASEMALDMDVNDPETEMAASIAITMDSTTYNINNISEITFPELTEENSLSPEELNSIGY